VPYVDESGAKYWLSRHGEHLDQDPRHAPAPPAGRSA